MGIFSIFKRKNGQGDEQAATPTRAGEPSRLAPDSEAARARQRQIALATAAKIDAIESAMALDIFNEPEPAWGSGVKRGARPVAADGASATLPMLELHTTELLADDDELPDATAHAESVPVIDEVAILYANDQLPLAEQMLVASLADVGRTERSVWWMLFDLYQINGQQAEFDNVAIDYASHFETSPPSWAPPAPLRAEQTFAGVTPTEAFAGILDDSIEAQLRRLLLPAAGPVARLEFARLREVTQEGCARLLAALRALRSEGRELIVAGAPELAEIVRSSIAIGRRDASDAAWLLLLELLQLMNREKEFEETAMDYCITYEVSPPSFEAPANVATSAAAQTPHTADRFMLPPLVASAAAPLLKAIDTYAAQAEPVLLDCSRLARIDYGAAGALLGRLRPLAAQGSTIELREVNHLVAALFKLLGYAEVARVFPHKY